MPKKDTINHRFKASQPHNTIEDHKGLLRYEVPSLLQQQDAATENYSAAEEYAAKVKAARNGMERGGRGGRGKGEGSKD